MVVQRATILDPAVGLGGASRLRPGTRRSLRLRAPGSPLRLAVAVGALTLGFALLGAANGLAAYRGLLGATLELAPGSLAEDLAAQTRHFLNVTAVLCAGWALAVTGLCAAWLHRLMGPTVALERLVRSLRRGDYAARVTLRHGDSAHARLARDLNELAQNLERAEQERQRERDRARFG